MTGPYLPTPPSWMTRALCAQTDPEVFYPEPGGSPFRAKQICGNCDVRPQCLQHALDTGEPHGVWGGRTRKERQKIRLGQPLPARVGECVHGHRYTPANTYTNPKTGRRQCRRCMADRDTAARKRRKA